MVQNETPAELSGYVIGRCLLTLGWSERTLARRLGRSQTDIRRVIAGEKALTPAESAWIIRIADFMRANKPPRRRAMPLPGLTE